jgi:hypothetical protein
MFSYSIAQMKTIIKNNIEKLPSVEAHGMLEHIRRFPKAQIDLLMVGDSAGPSLSNRAFSSQNTHYGPQPVAVNSGGFASAADSQGHLTVGSRLFNFPVEHFWVLEDYCTLRDYGWSSDVKADPRSCFWQCLYVTVRPGAMAIWVQFPDLGKFMLDVDAADTVAQLKTTIKQHLLIAVDGSGTSVWAELAHLPATTIGIIFSGQVLHDERTLADCRVVDNVTVTGCILRTTLKSSGSLRLEDETQEIAAGREAGLDGTIAHCTSCN